MGAEINFNDNSLYLKAIDHSMPHYMGEVSRVLKGRDQREVQLLDLACGTGRFLASVMDAFQRLNATGLDLSPNYTKKAAALVKSWPNAEVIEGQAEAMPLFKNRKGQVRYGIVLWT